MFVVNFVVVSISVFNIVVAVVAAAAAVDDDDDDTGFDGKVGIRDGNRDGDIELDSIFLEGDGILDFLLLSSLFISILSY
jgi:hypothetical protein